MWSQNLPVICLFAGAIGCFEWYLAVKRMVAIMRRQPCTVALTVFLETYLAFAVTLYSIKEFSIPEALIAYGIYCLGGALGSILPMRKSGTLMKIDAKSLD